MSNSRPPPNITGELKIFPEMNKRMVIIDYGKPVTWIAVDPAMAKVIAYNILAAANHLDKEFPTNGKEHGPGSNQIDHGTGD